MASAGDDALAAILLRTLSRAKEDVAAAGRALSEYEQQPNFAIAALRLPRSDRLLGVCHFSYVEAGRPEDPGSEGLQQAAAISAKNFLVRIWDIDGCLSAERPAIITTTLNVLFACESPPVTRLLVGCVRPLLKNLESCPVVINEITRAFIAFWTGGRITQIVTAIQCIKAILHVYFESPDLQDTIASLMAPATLHCFGILHVTTERGHYGIRKLLSNIIARVALSKKLLRPLINLWVRDPTALSAWCTAVIEVLREAPSGGSLQQALLWKAKARITLGWDNITQALIPRSQGNSPTSTPEHAAHIATVLQQAYGVVIDALIAILDTAPPDGGDPDSVPAIAFGKFAVAALSCLGRNAMHIPSVMAAYIQPKAQQLLGGTFFRFLHVTAEDTALDAGEAEEYAGIVVSELGSSLRCPCGTQLSLDCAICEMRSADAGLRGMTPRGCAMTAIREIIRLTGASVMLGPYLAFLANEMEKCKITDSTAAIMSTRIAAVRAFASAADLITQVEIPAATKATVDIIRNVLIPGTSISDDVPLNAMYRGLCCVVLERFLEPLDHMQLHSDMSTALQSIMTCLADKALPVREQALASFHCSFAERTALERRMSEFAPTAMSWLIQLLTTSPDATAQVLATLATILYKYGSQLGAVDRGCSTCDSVRSTTICNYHMAAGAAEALSSCQLCIEARAAAKCDHHRASMTAVRVSLFDEFSRRMAALNAEITHCRARGDSGGIVNFERDMTRYIQVMHPLIISSPGDPSDLRSIRADLLQPFAKYCEVLLTPSVLSAAINNTCEAEAMDALGMLPRTKPEVWQSVLPRLFDVLQSLPQAVEMLGGLMCDWLSVLGIASLAGGCGERYSGVVLTLAKEPSAKILCYHADLVRALVLCSAMERPAEGHRNVVNSEAQRRAGRPASENAGAATAFRRPLVVMLMHQLQASTAVVSEEVARRQLPIRQMSALMAAMYVDPAGTFAAVLELCRTASEQVYTGTDLTKTLCERGVAFFTSFFDQRTSSYTDRRSLDVMIPAMGLTELLQHLLAAGVQITALGGLFKALVVMAFKCLSVAVFPNGVDCDPSAQTQCIRLAACGSDEEDCPDDDLDEEGILDEIEKEANRRQKREMRAYCGELEEGEVPSDEYGDDSFDDDGDDDDELSYLHFLRYSEPSVEKELQPSLRRALPDEPLLVFRALLVRIIQAPPMFSELEAALGAEHIQILTHVLASIQTRFGAV